MALTVTENVRNHRERYRAQGLRPVQFWVPDIRNQSFRETIQHEAALIAEVDSEDGDYWQWADGLTSQLWEAE